MPRIDSCYLTLACALALSLGACGDDQGQNEASTDTSGEGTGSGDGDGDGDGDGILETSDSGAAPDCGDGVVDEGEVCDDGNNVTEFPSEPASAGAEWTYAPDDCMSDCSMLLADCGNGEVDPGEACDDGNADSMDACTTSCTLNTMSSHAACTRSTGNSDTDVASGEIGNCDSVDPFEGYEVGCILSTNLFNVSYVFAAEGDCQMITLKCIDENCALAPPDIGDLDNADDCPDGYAPIVKTAGTDSTFIPDIASKACQPTCESDSECRWNARDDFDNAGWLDNGGTPYGQYRCQVSPDSAGMKICVDLRNIGI